MKKNKKVFLTILFLMVMLIAMLNSNNSYAVLQVNGGEPSTDEINNWIINFRKMEELGGTLGLEETINDDLTSVESNNLDCHMIKNTEYGALAILSASSYGNPYKIEDGDTTTGNKTGAYMRINSEAVTEFHSQTYFAENLKNAAERYKVFYYGVYNPYRAGDAVLQTRGWHNSNSQLGGVPTSGMGYFGGMARAINNSIFDYEIRRTESKMASRPVIVVGEGF